jgi:NAD-dependent dihydropyrimidine dehydrogenase PreA subunit
MSEKKAYKDLIDHFRNWILDLPDSEILMPMLELRFTPEEAKFLSRFPHRPHTVEELSEKYTIPADGLIEMMKPMMKEGFIYSVEGRSAVRYSLPDHLFSFYRMPGWKNVDDAFNRKLAPMINRYYIDHLGADFMGHPTKGLRAIPVKHTVKDTRQIIPYEDLMLYVDQEDYHTVSTCACRHRHNLDPDFETCKHETLNCLHFGRLGQYIVKNDMGKEITREETLEILAAAADAGLVHGISNTQMGMDTICSCCSCCCLLLEADVKLPPGERMGHQRSNYILEINHDTCKACGLCAERCPVNALELRDKENAPEPEEGKKLKPKDLKEVLYNPDLCIGCGVCAHKCPTQSLSLKRRGDAVEDIPKNMSDIAIRMMEERKRDLSRIF